MTSLLRLGATVAITPQQGILCFGVVAEDGNGAAEAGVKPLVGQPPKAATRSSSAVARPT